MPPRTRGEIVTDIPDEAPSDELDPIEDGVDVAALIAENAALKADRDARLAAIDTEGEKVAAGARKATGHAKPYIVLNDAISVRLTASKNDGVRLVTRGHRVMLDPGLVDIDNLVALRAIEPYTGQSKAVRTTPAMAALASGAIEDEVQMPVEMVNRMPAAPEANPVFDADSIALPA